MRWWIGIVINLFFIPGSFAVEMEFYTYGGFAEMLQAFTRIALIFNDGNYAALIFVAVVFGLIFGGSISFGKAMFKSSPDGVFGIGWLLSVLMGVGIYQALIIPKGSIHLYDPVHNEYQEVPGVPDLIVITAGMLNHVERTLIMSVDDGSAFPYGSEAGGVSYQLLHHIPKTLHTMNDEFFNKSIRRYFQDCGQVALAIESSEVDINELRHTTTDMANTFSKFRSPSNFTVHYTSDNKSGATLSCQNAWNTYIETLNDDDFYENWITALCEMSGYPADNEETRERCEESINSVGIRAFATDQDSVSLLRNIYLAEMTQEALIEMNPDLRLQKLANRSAMNEGIGIAQIANDWLPTIRSTTYSILLGCIPFIVLLVVTPLLWRALWVFFGLFLFMTLWGFTDAVIHRAAMDHSLNVMAQMATHRMGMDAILMMPDQSMKALAIFGKARSVGVTLAAALAALLFKFSSYAFANIASGWTQGMERQGEDASRVTQTPEGWGQTVSGMTQAVSTAGGIAATGGFGNYSMAMATQHATTAGESAGINQYAGQRGFGSVQVAQQLSGVAAGAQWGRLERTQALTDRVGGDGDHPGDLGRVSRTISGAEMDQRAGQTLGKEQAYADMGMGMFSGSYATQSIDSTLAASRSFSVGRLVDQVHEQRQQNGLAPIDTEAAYGVIAQHELANLSGSMAASKGDVRPLEQLNERQTEMSLAGMTQLVKTMDEQGISFEDVAKAESAMRGYRATGQSLLLDEVDSTHIVAAEYYNQQRQVANGMALEEVSQRWGPPELLLAAMANVSTADELAKTIMNVQKQELLDGDAVDVSISQMGSASHTLGPEQVQTLRDKGVLHEAVDGASGSVQATIAMDSQGNIATTSVQDGDSFSQNNRAWSDDSQSYSAGVNIQGGATMRALLSHPNQTKNLAGILENAENHPDARHSLLFDMAQHYKSVINSNETRSESISVSANGSVGGSTTQFLGAAARGSVGGSISGSAGEQDHYDPQIYLAQKLFEQSLDRSTKELRADGVNTSFDGYEELRYQRAAEHLQGMNRLIVESDFNQNQEVSKDTDRIDALLDKVSDKYPPIRLEPDKETFIGYPRG